MTRNVQYFFNVRRCVKKFYLKQGAAFSGSRFIKNATPVDNSVQVSRNYNYPKQIQARTEDT